MLLLLRQGLLIWLFNELRGGGLLFGIENFEFQILNILHNLVDCDFMDFLMVTVSAIGNSGAVWIVTALLMIISKKYRRWGAVLGVGLLLGLVFGNVILKNVIARPRPCWLFEDIDMLISVPLDYSFPSGHTLASFTSAFLLLSADKRLGIPALVLAILIAFSRMYLFAHFPTDVLGAMAISGIIYLLLVKRFKNKEL